MKKLTDLEYLRLNTFQRLWYNIVLFVLGIPGWLASLVSPVMSATQADVNSTNRRNAAISAIRPCRVSRLRVYRT